VLVESPAALREEAFLLSAQLFFIASDMRFLAAAVIPRFDPRLVAAEVARGPLASFDLRAAHRAFIASDRRRRPAAVIPPRFLVELLVAAAACLFAIGALRPIPPSSAAIAS
jgi:hypothetical protein